MFTDLSTDRENNLSIRFNGTLYTVATGISVAAALLSVGVVHYRETPLKNSRRGAFCMMGVCFDCLCIIDGAPNRQACMTTVRHGMIVEQQTGAAEFGLQEPVE